MNKPLEQIYETLVITAPAEGEARLILNRGHGLKDIFSELKKYITAKYGEDVIDMLERGGTFEKFKEHLLTLVSSCDISDRVKNHLIKKINNAHSICKLYSIINTNHLLG